MARAGVLLVTGQGPIPADAEGLLDSQVWAVGGPGWGLVASTGGLPAVSTPGYSNIDVMAASVGAATVQLETSPDGSAWSSLGAPLVLPGEGATVRVEMVGLSAWLRANVTVLPAGGTQLLVAADVS
jgi:hypothetical protein